MGMPYSESVKKSAHFDGFYIIFGGGQFLKSTGFFRVFRIFCNNHAILGNANARFGFREKFGTF
jgi:hypothetical protein